MSLLYDFRSESTKLSSLDVEEVTGGGGQQQQPHFHHSTHTLQLTRKKPAGQPKAAYNSLQRHSSANIEEAAHNDNSVYARGGSTSYQQRDSGDSFGGPTRSGANNNNGGDGGGFPRSIRNRGSNNNLDYDNVESCGGGMNGRSRNNRNLGDGLGEITDKKNHDNHIYF